MKIHPGMTVDEYARAAYAKDIRGTSRADIEWEMADEEVRKDYTAEAKMILAFALGCSLIETGDDKENPMH